MVNESNTKGTVTVRLVGGIGNQMFQYAAALRLAEHQNKKLYVCKKRSYRLDRLKVPQDIYIGEPLDELLKHRVVHRLRSGYAFVRPLLPTYVDDYIRRKKIYRNLRGVSEGFYRESNFHFDPKIFDISADNILLNGYFQSPRYFEGVEKLLRRHFQLKSPLTKIADNWAEKISASPNSISLHVRRGNYLSPDVSKVIPVLDRDYYDRAIALMKDLVGPKIEFFLFSDEPDFIAETFKDLPHAHVVRSDPTTSWEDMFLMARCRHNIIANSTYSWWGAWLNPAKDKRVIAPAHWFTSNKLTTCNILDIYPDDWIILK